MIIWLPGWVSDGFGSQRGWHSRGCYRWPLEDESDGNQSSDLDDFQTEQLELHDVRGADRQSVASSWDGASGGEDEADDPFSSARMQGGDEGMATGEQDDWDVGCSKSGNADEGGGSHDQRYTDTNNEAKNSTGAQLPPSDPFVLVSLHAGAHLENYKKDDMRNVPW